LNFLDVNGLQKVALFALFLVACLAVHDHLAFLCHVHIFEALALVQLVFVLLRQKEILFFVNHLIQSLEQLPIVVARVFLLQSLQLYVDIDRDALETEKFLDVEIDLSKMGLLLLELIAEGLIEHIAYPLRDFQVVVGQNVRQGQHQLAVVANQLAEINLVL